MSSPHNSRTFLDHFILLSQHIAETLNPHLNKNEKKAKHQNKRTIPWLYHALLPIFSALLTFALLTRVVCEQCVHTFSFTPSNVASFPGVLWKYLLLFLVNGLIIPKLMNIPCLDINAYVCWALLMPGIHWLSKSSLFPASKFHSSCSREASWFVSPVILFWVLQLRFAAFTL